MAKRVLETVRWVWSVGSAPRRDIELKVYESTDVIYNRVRKSLRYGEHVRRFAESKIYKDPIGHVE